MKDEDIFWMIVICGPLICLAIYIACKTGFSGSFDSDEYWDD